LFLVDFIFSDLPFGIGMADWDVASWTSAELRKVINQVAAVNNGNVTMWVSVINIDDYKDYKAVFKERNWQTVHPFAWMKEDHNQTGVNCYIYAWETLLVAYYPNANAVNWYTSKNPLHRPNYCTLPGITKRLLHNDGSLVNPHEKPPGLIEFFLKNHVDPNSWVMIIGSGAGGDIAGAIKTQNVVAVERDEKQWARTVARFSNMEVEIKEVAEEKIAAAEKAVELANKKKKAKEAADKKMAEDPTQDPDAENEDEVPDVSASAAAPSKLVVWPEGTTCITCENTDVDSNQQLQCAVCSSFHCLLCLVFTDEYGFRCATCSEKD
jgi:hypothetical protein